MRPVKLTVQAFAPFAGRVEMDFRAIGGAPLFGIYGPTGGGKTSILDAICYALFGESSGGDRSAEHLRSHFADPDVDTFVELIFAIGKQRFFVRRSPTQAIARKRGPGLTERQHEAYLFDVTGLSIDEVVYPDSPGMLLAEKKVRGVDERIEGLLGYKASQFRQVVVLPQGRFRELLTAQSRDRSDILRKLFDTSVYMRLTLRLKERRKAIKDDLERSKEAMKTILDGVNVETVDSLAAAIEDKDAEIAIADRNVQRWHVEVLKAETAWEQGKQLDDRFKELDMARAAVDTFTARAAEVEKQAARLGSAEAALRVAPLADTADAAATALREALVDLDTKKAGAAEAAIELDRAARAFADREAKEPEREARRRHLADLERFRNTWTGLAETRDQFTKARQTAATAATDFARAEQAARDAEDNLKQARLAEERVVNANAEKAILERDVERLTAANRTRAELADTLTKIAEMERDLRTATSEQDAARGAAMAARKDREALETAFLSSTAAGLASGLQTGEPCPVCGSTDHPFPATPGGETVTRGQVDAARTAFDDAGNRFNDRRDRVVGLASDLKPLQARAFELTASTQAHEAFANKIEDLDRLQEALDTATSLVQSEDDTRDGRAGAATTLEAALEHREAAREAIPSQGGVHAAGSRIAGGAQGRAGNAA